MIALFLGAALAAPADLDATDPYATDAVYAFVAIANERVVDGIPYTNGKGIASIGGSWTRPSGFFVSAEFNLFRGDGRPLPGTTLSTSDVALGWGVRERENRFSISLIDYRVFGSDSTPGASHGAALEYRRGRFTTTLAVERDKPYYTTYRGFLATDARRISFAWTQPVNETFSWYAGAGVLDLDYYDLRHEYVGGGVLWQWHSMEWQAAFTKASDDLAYLAGEDVSDVQLVLRVSRSFRLE